ncbi:MAG: FtsH protease activity modulator HflK, partial [Planctomycetota bacterium]
AKGGTERQESLMLTGDLKVIDVEWVVQYRIDDPDKWLHQVRNPRETIRDVSEAVMRRVVGNRLGSNALTEGRPEIAEEVKREMQLILEDGKEGGDDYEMGIHIGSVEMQDVTPPDPVKPAFNEVNKARQEKESLINEAEKLRNRIIPRARGEAEQTISEAEAYAAERVNAAKGQAARFLAILEEYSKAPEVTRQRLYIEMADSVFPGLGQIYILQQGANQPLPLLDMNRAGAAGRGGQR